jgi:hypothetical protein
MQRILKIARKIFHRQLAHQGDSSVKFAEFGLAYYVLDVSASSILNILESVIYLRLERELVIGWIFAKYHFKNMSEGYKWA